MDKKKLEKRLVIAFQIFAVIGLIIIGFYLNKAIQASNEKKEVIKDFGNKFVEFKIDSSDSKYSITMDNKTIDIENKSDGVYLNNKKINFDYAMGGYTLDKVLMLYSVGQTGYKIIFINKDLVEIPFDNSDYIYTNLELVNGSIQGIGYKYENIMGCRNINNLNICECNSIEDTDILFNHKEDLNNIRDKVISGTVKLSYDGNSITTTYIDKETINDIYGPDLDGVSSSYCVITYN